MILDKQKEVEVFTEGEQNESIAMSLDMDSMHMLMSMLSKNLYSDEIGSPIRELASNALDSHRRAKVDKPIIVALKRNAQYQWEFTVEDMGVGLDDKDVKEIISKYGKSLAREEVDALGLMGLGFKSPLAYASAFYFIARKNGTERKYMMYEGEEGNMIDLLSEQPTTQGNGVKVVLPVKIGDKALFIEKIKEQLAYFEGVYFDVEGLDNSFKILRADDFQQSEMSNDSNLHICLDNVYYPIDFNKLGIPVINVPIGLRFGLRDGIYPVPSRESLRYTPVAKAKIIAKIRDVANYMVQKYNDTVAKDATIWDVLDYYDKTDRNILIGSTTMDISDLMKYATVKMIAPKLAGVSLLDLERVHAVKSYLISEYSTKFRIRYGKMSEYKKDSALYTWELEKPRETFYVYSDKISGVMRDYIKHLTGYHGDARIVKKVRHFKLGSSKYSSGHTYYEILELKKYPKWKWRQVIKEWQYIQSLMMANFTDIDKIVIPQDWIDSRKKMRVVTKKGSFRGQYIKLQGEAVGKKAVDLERCVGGQNCKFVPETIKFQELHKYKGLTVYTDHDNSMSLDALYSICNYTQHRIRCLTFSNREMKNLAEVDVHNVMTYQKFMKGTNKPFKRLVTAYLINKLMDTHKHTFSKMDYLKTISKDLYNKLTGLKGYREKYYKTSNETIYQAMLKVAIANNSFDTHIYDVYLKVKEILEKHPFVESILKVAGNRYSNYGTLSTDDVNKILCDLFKYYKFRIDVNNYKKPAPKPVQAVIEDPIVPIEDDDDDEEASPLTDQLLEEIQEELLEDQVA